MILLKKLAIIFLISFLFVGCSSKKEINSFDKYSFYRKEYLNRYILYKKNHPSLDIEDVVTYVNIGLDNAFYTNTRESTYLNKKEIIINKYTYVSKAYTPDNLVLMEKYSKPNIYLVKEAYDAFIEMVEDIKKDNLNIRAISAYRDVSYQEDLYNSYLEKDSSDIVDTYSARPGFSEHHSGLSIDIDNIYTSYEYFEYTDEYTWMMDNAYKYGYILRYPKDKENITGYQYESWHFRYVGKKIATYLHRHPITYDEYFVKYIEKN